MINSVLAVSSNGTALSSIITVSLIVAAVVAIIACVVIILKYKMKIRPTNYPLDKYTNMSLTESSDTFVGSYIRTRRINTQRNSNNRK